MMSCLHEEKEVKLPKKKKKKKQRPLRTTYLLTNHKTEEKKKMKLCYPPSKKKKKQWSTQFNESQRCVRAYTTQMTLFLFHVWAPRRCVCFSDGIWRTEVLIRSVYSLEQNILLWKYRNTVRYTAVSVSCPLTKGPKNKPKQRMLCIIQTYIQYILCHAALEKHLSFHNKINGSRFMELTREGRPRVFRHASSSVSLHPTKEERRFELNAIIRW